MSKSKAIVIVKQPDPQVAAQWHQYVIDAGAISAASAILCGKALVDAQKQLKGSGGTFEQWFDKHQASLGFSRRTASHYLGAFRETKSKLLKTADKGTLALLEADTHRLSQADRKKLFNAVRKCIGAQTLMEIYLEAEIVKNGHKAPLRIGGGDQPGEDGPEQTVDEAIAEQLELFGQRSNCLHSKTKLGKADVLLVSQWPKAKLDTAIAIVKRDLQLLVKVKGAMQ